MVTIVTVKMWYLGFFDFEFDRSLKKNDLFCPLEFPVFILFQSPSSSLFSICNYSSTVMGGLISSGPFVRPLTHLSSKHFLSFCSLSVLISLVFFILFLHYLFTATSISSNSCLGVIVCFFSIYLFNFYRHHVQ
jgi:hypothetical protein